MQIYPANLSILQGFSPLVIACMHEKGAWVIREFASKNRINVRSECTLERISKGLNLQVTTPPFSQIREG
jgi:hypothetical protein